MIHLLVSGSFDWLAFDDAIFCTSVLEQEGKTETETEAMEISTRSKGKKILFSLFLDSNLYVCD